MADCGMASWKELCFGNENTVVLVMDLLTDLGSLHFSGFLFPSSGKKKKKKKKKWGEDCWKEFNG